MGPPGGNETHVQEEKGYSDKNEVAKGKRVHAKPKWLNDFV